MSVCVSLLWTCCLMAVVILHDFSPLSSYINSERKLAVFCSYVLNSSARQHAECSFWNCDGQIKITTCLSRQNDHSMMLPAEINSAVDSRRDSEAVYRTYCTSLEYLGSLIFYMLFSIHFPSIY